MKRCANTTKKIYFWPTKDWVFGDDLQLEQYLSFMSDDYGVLEVSCEATEEEIDLLIEKKLKEGWGNDS